VIVRLDGLVAGEVFWQPALALTGVVQHVSQCQVRVRIQRGLGKQLEYTAWSCGTEVVPIPASAGLSAFAATTQAGTGAERAEQNSPKNWTPQFRHTVSALVCAGCGQSQPRNRGAGRPRRFCSPACRTAAYRARRTP
jgi:hypothetical protein